MSVLGRWILKKFLNHLLLTFTVGCIIYGLFHLFPDHTLTSYISKQQDGSYSFNPIDAEKPFIQDLVEVTALEAVSEDDLLIGTSRGGIFEWNHSYQWSYYYNNLYSNVSEYNGSGWLKEAKDTALSVRDIQVENGRAYILYPDYIAFQAGLDDMVVPGKGSPVQSGKDFLVYSAYNSPDFWCSRDGKGEAAIYHHSESYTQKGVIKDAESLRGFGYLGGTRSIAVR